MHVHLKRFLLWLSRRLGRELSDQRTGLPLGRALCLPGRRGIAMVGLPHAVRAIFLPESTTRYTKQRIGFQKHETPDYPALQGKNAIVKAEKLLWVVLVHQTPGEVARLQHYWETLGFSSGGILFVHAGRREDFEGLQIPNKVFVSDKEIRTVHHPIEKQSYGGVLREVTTWMQGREFETVALVEYDHLPLVPEWGERMCAKLEEEQADVLFHHLCRVDGTNAAHYLYHLEVDGFEDLWRPMSCREEKTVFLNAIVTGSLWRRAAFEAVAARPEPLPVYLELYLPSLAHHLGFRVRDHGEQDQFVQVVPIQDPFSPHWIKEGAWSLHQVKSLAGFTTASPQIETNLLQ